MQEKMFKESQTTKREARGKGGGSSRLMLLGKDHKIVKNAAGLIAVA